VLSIVTLTLVPAVFVLTNVRRCAERIVKWMLTAIISVSLASDISTAIAGLTAAARS